MARPTKLTKKVQSDILDSVRNGCYFEQSALAAGIVKQTLYNWIARGQEGGASNALYVEFLDAITRAEAEAEVTMTVALYRGALTPAKNDAHRAQTEYLRRRHPDRWSTQDRIRGTVEHSGKTTQTVEHHFPDTDEWHERVSAVYGAALNGDGN